jgi:hypothetical protein
LRFATSLSDTFSGENDANPSNRNLLMLIGKFLVSDDGPGCSAFDKPPGWDPDL